MRALRRADNEETGTGS